MSTDPRLALYVSDLDGTLLRSDGSLSPYSVRTLNRLIGEGLRFTVASARGCGPIRSALAGLRLTLPVINQNGAFVSELASGRHLAIQALPPVIAHDLWSLLDDARCRPFLMTFDGAFDRLYYNDGILRNDGMRRFLLDRQRVRDPRLTPLDHLADGLEDQVVCLTTIDTPARVRHLQQEMRRRHGGSIDLHCHKEFDPHWYILAVHDARATKDQGVDSIKRVQDLADCRVVVFGTRSTTSTCSAWPTKRTRSPAPLLSSSGTPPPSSAPTMTMPSRGGWRCSGARSLTRQSLPHDLGTAEVVPSR